MSGESASDRGAGAVDQVEKKIKMQKKTDRGCFWLFISFVILVVLYMVVTSVLYK